MLSASSRLHLHGCRCVVLHVECAVLPGPETSSPGRATSISNYSGACAPGLLARSLHCHWVGQDDSIGQVAKGASVGVETVRFYEREGLVPEKLDESMQML